MSSEWSSEERSPFESNLFHFKRKESNLAASYSLGIGLGVGLILGLITVFFFDGGWYKSIAFGTVFGGLVGLAVGFIIGTRLDGKKKKKKKSQNNFDE